MDKIAIVKSKYVTNLNGIFTIKIGFGYKDLGFQIHTWGLRFMFIWWHVCIHYK